MPSRRSFLRNMLAGALGAACPALAGADEPVHLPLQVAAGPPISVPKNFTGLGYEMSSVATPGLLRPGNRRYVELVRGLGPAGVLRVGGIVANYTRYQPNGVTAFDRKNTVITHSSLEGFGAFLAAIGWRAIWSLNFAQGTLDQAVEEARAVAAVLGPRLLALEIGNEVENYGRSQPFRPSTYDYEDYRREFEQWRAALVKAVPEAAFAAPDTAQSVEWVERMAQDARGQVQLLTTHYYRNGQRHGSAEQLLHPDARLENVVERMRAASKQAGVPWRLCEMNSFSGGGLPGVSDTFVGTLWTLNTMLFLAQSGCAGVNMETGVNQLGFISSYSPIQDDGHGMNTAGAPYYGMLAFAEAFAGCGRMLPLTGFGAQQGVSAYAFGAAARPCSVVIVNMTRRQTRASLAALGIEHASVLRLIAPSPGSKSGVTFGGAAVDADGRWKSQSRETVRHGQIAVPAMSAAVLRAHHQ